MKIPDEKEYKIYLQRFLTKHNICQAGNSVNYHKWYDDTEKMVSLYFGSCFGVLVHQISPDHVFVHLLVEDDGYWYFDQNTGFSACWCDDIIALLKAVKKKFKAHILTPARKGRNH